MVMAKLFAIGCITCMNCPIKITCTDIQYHCYRASNRYNPAEPLPYFSPSLHKFNREFTPPSEQKLRLAHWVLCTIPQI